MENTNTLLPENLNIEQYQSNLEQCLKSETRFTGTEYYNICTGENNFVPFGAWDFTLAFILTALGIAFIGFLCKVVFDRY